MLNPIQIHHRIKLVTILDEKQTMCYCLGVVIEDFVTMLSQGKTGECHIGESLQEFLIPTIIGF